MAFGDQRPFVVTMIAIDMQTVGTWAEKQGLAYELHGPQPQARGGGVDRAGDRQGERHPAGRAAGAALSVAQQGLDADDAEMTRPQGPPPFRRRSTRT